jgi:hypothetical protein
LGEGCEEGQGSLVYFNEARMFQSSETDQATLQAAIQAGHSGRTDYTDSIQKSFEKHVEFFPITYQL